MTLVETKGLNVDDLAGGGLRGWDNAWGEEEIHRYVLPVVQKGDHVIDFGAGFGRCSFPFALKGAIVTPVENNRQRLKEIRQVFEKAGLEHRLLRPLTSDIFALDPKETGLFKFSLAIDAVTHMRKSAAKKFMFRLPDFLTDEGILCFSAPSVFSNSYEIDKEYYEEIEKDTFMVYCACGGEGPKPEQIAFWFPAEIEAIFKRLGAKILYSSRVDPHKVGDFKNFIIARF